MAEPGILPKTIQFGSLFLLELINTGGMAEVYRAKKFGAEGFEKQLAVKKILPKIAADQDFINMFIDEAKITVLLNHPNIAQIEDLGRIEGCYCIIMEYIAGLDLRAIFKHAVRQKKFLDIPLICHILVKVCDGLGYAHQKTDANNESLHVVHRDISPQNILVSYEGEVKIIDFGIAKATTKQTETEAGVLKGKFSYMSPEQVQGKPLDQRSDLFSLGIVMYEMLTSQRLFDAESEFEILKKVTTPDFKRPSQYNPSIPVELEGIILKTLSQNPDDRYQTAFELGQAIENFLRRHAYHHTPKELSAFMKGEFKVNYEEELRKQRLFQSWNLDSKPEFITDKQRVGIPQELQTLEYDSAGYVISDVVETIHYDRESVVQLHEADTIETSRTSFDLGDFDENAELPSFEGDGDGHGRQKNLEAETHAYGRKQRTEETPEPSSQLLKRKQVVYIVVAVIVLVILAVISTLMILSGANSNG